MSNEVLHSFQQVTEEVLVDKVSVAGKPLEDGASEARAALLEDAEVGSEDELEGLGLQAVALLVADDGIGLREVARALTKFVFPGAASAVSGTVAFAGTMAIGAAARAYYLRGATLQQARAAYEDERGS